MFTFVGLRKAVAKKTGQHVPRSAKLRLLELEDRITPAGFTDGFEGAALDSFWTKTEISGFVTMPSTEAAHSGSQSVKFTSTNSGVSKNVGLGHDFGAPTYGEVSVWIFDTGAGVCALARRHISLRLPSEAESGSGLNERGGGLNERRGTPWC